MACRATRARGIGLVDFILALSLVSVGVGVIVPPLLSAIDVENKQVALNRNLMHIFDGMALSLTRHWQQTQCRRAPNVNLSQLISAYGVPNAVRSQYAPSVQFISASQAPYNARMLRITLNAKHAQGATQISQLIDIPKVWVSLHGTRVRIEKPVAVIESTYEHFNFNPQNGCVQ